MTKNCYSAGEKQTRGIKFGRDGGDPAEQIYGG